MVSLTRVHVLRICLMRFCLPMLGRQTLDLGDGVNLHDLAWSPIMQLDTVSFTPSLLLRYCACWCTPDSEFVWLRQAT